MTAIADIETLATELDDALARRKDLDPLPRQVLDDALAALNALHKEGLTTIVRTLRADPRGKELLFELVDDPAVRMIFAMHELIRASDPRALAERVLDTIRPGIRSHGGDVVLERLDDGVAYVKLTGACNGCSLASVTMRNGVESALIEGVPQITAVEVVPNEPQLLQITQVTASDTGWFKTFPVERIAPGSLEPFSLRPSEGEAVEVIVVNTRGKLAAYVNACAHQGMPLDNALVDGTEGTVTCPWHGFTFDAATGECLTLPGAQLEPLPLRIEDGHIWVRRSYAA